MAAVLVAIAGCTLRGPRAGESVGASDAAAAETAVAGLLRYGNRLRTLSPDERAAEYRRVQQSMEEKADTEATLRMAMLLTVPESDFHDPARGQQLLGQVSAGETGATAAERDMAGLLAALLAQGPAAAMGAASACRDRPECACIGRDQDVALLRQALSGERARCEGLEQQLNALRQLEENLGQRDNGTD